MNVRYDVRGPILVEAQRLEAEGHKVMKLNIGNPALFGFEAPEAILVDMIANLPSAQGYSDSHGIFQARTAVANPSLEDIESRVTDRTTAIVLINPNNPTGAVYSEEIVKGFVEIAERHDLVLMADEIYESGCTSTATDQVRAHTSDMPITAAIRQPLTIRSATSPSDREGKPCTRGNLLRWFEDSILGSAIRVNSVDRPLPLDLVRIFDYPGDFVPVVVTQDDTTSTPPGAQVIPRVIDKHALSLQLARSFVTDLLEESTR